MEKVTQESVYNTRSKDQKKIKGATKSLMVILDIFAVRLTSKMIYHGKGGGEPERACTADLMFCHGTQNGV